MNFKMFLRKCSISVKTLSFLKSVPIFVNFIKNKEIFAFSRKVKNKTDGQLFHPKLLFHQTKNAKLLLHVQTSSYKKQ